MKPDENQQAVPSVPSEKFETDAQKLVRRHLEDENHTITEEEIRNIKVGVDPLPQEDGPSESE
jgi:nitrogen regulatory protein PII-like uncharacterized protein